MNTAFLEGILLPTEHLYITTLSSTNFCSDKKNTYAVKGPNTFSKL